jgi:hypothetical protein
VEGREPFVLGVHQGVTIPRGVLHHPRAHGRTVLLLVEPAEVGEGVRGGEMCDAASRSNRPALDCELVLRECRVIALDHEPAEDPAARSEDGDLARGRDHETFGVDR